MSKNQTIQEFDENFFSSFAVPKVKDYSRLSSSPSRDQPCETSYFEKNFLNPDTMQLDTPVKMRMATADREDALPTANMDLFLSSSSSSEATVHPEQTEVHQEKEKEKQHHREPLKIVPSEPTYGEAQLIEGIEKLTMFAPKSPEQRLSQRRRSEQKKKEEEETKRRSMLTRPRSISTKRSVSREPSVPRSRQNSVTRTISAPNPGVVTRAMAARAAENTAKPAVRRSVMPIKVAQKTPVAALKMDTANGDRSRDRTRRTNTTGSSSARRSVMPNKPAGSTTPVIPPRRTSSASKAPASATKSTPKTRPIATANRSSILRMNMVKPTAPPAALEADQKKITRPVVPAVPRTRQPLRVNPGSPSVVKKAVKPSSTQRPAQPPRARSVDRGQPPVVTGTPVAKTSRTDLFNRLSTPKTSATPVRVSHDGPTASIRKSAVRPVPSYVYSVNNGLPSSGGLHGIRAPSKDRLVQKKSEQPTKKQ